jgi:hypothetical protein
MELHKKDSGMKVTNRQALHNFRPDDGFDGWQRIVASLVIAASAIGTLRLTHSIELATAITLLVMVPLGLTPRK